MKNTSLSSIPSISSESLNIQSGDSLPSPRPIKEESLKLCINEFNSINKRLEEKCKSLKQWEEQLQTKETKIINLCNSVNKYIESEVLTKTMKVIKESEQKCCELERKYDALYRDHKRLQCSFETIKSQNKSLTLKLEECCSNGEVMRKEKEKLTSKIATLSKNNKKYQPVNLKSVAVQTASIADRANNLVSPYQEKRMDSILPFTSLLRDLWLRMFELSVKEDTHSFVDACLIMIPLSIDYLRANTFAISEISTSVSARKRQMDVMVHHIEMLYWSLVFMDMSRVPLRQGMMSPLTRLGEELALMLVSKVSTCPPLVKKIFTRDDETLALVVLLALRSVNQKDILSLLLQYLCDLVEKREAMWGLLLSRCFYVPLLCRWTSSSTLYCTLYHKILDLVLESVRHKAVCGRAPRYIDEGGPADTGLDQLTSLICKLPLRVTESQAASTCHPLVFLLDVLHTSRPGARDTVLALFEKLVASRRVRALSRELGVVGLLSGLVAQQALPSDPASFPASASRLRLLLSHLTVRPDSSVTIYPEAV